MSVMAIMLALVAVLFFLAIGGVYLLLSFIGRMTEPKEQDGERSKIDRRRRECHLKSLANSNLYP